MKWLKTILLVLLPLLNLKAQNFILNPDFEIISDCPRVHSSLHLAENWESPSNGTPDLFNTCDTNLYSVGVPSNMFGNLQPVSGNAYAGIHFVFEDDYREYIKTRLNDCLREGQTYEIKFWVALSGNKNSPISSEFIEMLFSPEDYFFNTRTILPIKPNVVWDDTVLIHESNKWVQITGHYTASGNERYMYVGNFHRNSDIPFTNNKSGTYLFLDKFSMQNPNSYFLSNCDQNLCRGDSINLAVSGIQPGQQIEWIDQNGNIISVDTSSWVSPVLSTKYYLKVNGVIVDSMNVLVNPSPGEHTDLLIDCFESPFKGILSSDIGLNVIQWSEGIWRKKFVELDSTDGWVYLVNHFGCADTLFYSTSECAKTVCKGEKVRFESSMTISASEWFFEADPNTVVSIGTLLDVVPSQSGMYYLRNGIEIIDSLRVHLLPKTKFDLNIDCTPKFNHVQILNQYGPTLWSDGVREAKKRVLARGEYWVEQSNQYGCTSREEFEIPNHCNELNVCPGDSVFLLNPNGESGFWIDGLTNEMMYVDSASWVIPDDDRTYIFRTNNGTIHTINVQVQPDYDIEFQITCENELPVFEVIDPVGFITWQNGSSSRSQLSDETNTWVEVLRDDGCVFREDLIYEKSCRNSFALDEIFIPNVITPNNDGKNDFFLIQGYLEQMQLRIYNRWGRLVYFSENYQNDWTGAELPAGDYFYQLSDQKLDDDVKGWVKVIR